jgi:DNA-binding transcriptional ArsR family regulator
MNRATPPLLRNLNERTVLEAIRDGAPISRAEISRRSGISKPTVSQALQSLLEASLVREASERPDGPGYGAVYFEPVPDAALILGLDVGARFVRGAICDLAGTIRARQDIELSVAVVPEAVAAIERCLRDRSEPRRRRRRRSPRRRRRRQRPAPPGRKRRGARGPRLR